MKLLITTLTLLTCLNIQAKGKNFLQKIPKPWKLTMSDNRPAIKNIKNKRIASIHRQTTNFSLKPFCRRYAGGAKYEVNGQNVCTIFVNNKFQKATQVVYRDVNNRNEMWILNFKGLTKKKLPRDVKKLRKRLTSNK